MLAQRAVFLLRSQRLTGQASCGLFLQATVRLLSGQPRTSSDSGVAADVAISSTKVQKLADEIMGLTVLECSLLSEILRKKLGVPQPAFGAPMAMPFPMPTSPAAGAGPAAAAPAEKKEEPKKEKTEFDIKLESFSAEGKIKVIKEIRALTNLGLKEAKELVEKAPVLIKAGVSKADAEAMKKQIEVAGGKVAIE
ncbi:mitochondrial ribosomal protein L7/L12 [Volvox carteri f. nagariensis]|uniref:Mitochondrial ribosomal protein L7/L12 n=1 Tax=Volvox carteri f. nagariensis TaxID=3068 RepID=D8TJI4_VOLCA|nr:mitochondrial ribosomal protein L7/L12 [Volvox carteri f. nagariensis]EFJ52547.1 mitochondrial ribosomal protein L7/L12 [Volvox carteri f. nagariensis]|eukprot:XP_002946620.1 mitochondrial ribosomal protein L7/L12 [Volvox carteri f. nagariensis]